MPTGSYLGSNNIKLSDIRNEWRLSNDTSALNIKLSTYTGRQAYDTGGVNQHIYAAPQNPVGFSRYRNRAYYHYMTIRPVSYNLTSTVLMYCPTEWGGHTNGYNNTSFTVRGFSNFGWDSNPSSAGYNGLYFGTLRGTTGAGSQVSITSYSGQTLTFVSSHIRQLLYRADTSSVLVRLQGNLVTNLLVGLTVRNSSTSVLNEFSVAVNSGGTMTDPGNGDLTTYFIFNNVTWFEAAGYAGSFLNVGVKA